MSPNQEHDVKRANKLPNEDGADELERSRQSALAGQERALSNAKASRESGLDDPNPFSPRDDSEGGHSDADQAKENERQALEDGRELPG